MVRNITRFLSDLWSPKDHVAWVQYATIVLVDVLLCFFANRQLWQIGVLISAPVLALYIGDSERRRRGMLTGSPVTRRAASSERQEAEDL